MLSGINLFNYSNTKHFVNENMVFSLNFGLFHRLTKINMPYLPLCGIIDLYKGGKS